MTSAGALYARRILDEEKLRRGANCEECGEQPGAEFHHVRPTGVSGRGRGMIRRALDIRRHRKAYRLLCPGCHAKLDPSRVLQRDTDETRRYE